MNRRQIIVAALAYGALARLASPLALAQGAAVGKPAPAFRVPDAEGRVRQLAEFAGKPVVLEWTSPSCPYVRAQYESGVMQELQKAAAGQGVVWLSVLSTHPSRRDYLAPQKAAAMHRTRGGTSTLLLDSEGTLGKAYGAVVTPHLFVVGGNGMLVYAGGAGDRSTMDASEVRASRSFVREALSDLAAGRSVATPTSRPFGCTIAYAG